jgi:hypothetical protein
MSASERLSTGKGITYPFIPYGVSSTHQDTSPDNNPLGTLTSTTVLDSHKGRDSQCESSKCFS